MGGRQSEMERMIPLNERETRRRVQERRRDRERDAYAHWVGEEVSRRRGGGSECRERETKSEEMTKIFTNSTRLEPSNC